MNKKKSSIQGIQHEKNPSREKSNTRKIQHEKKSSMRRNGDYIISVQIHEKKRLKLSRAN